MDGIDRRLLNLMQADFPLTREPYADLGRRFGISGAEIIRRIAELKRRGIVRLISPVLDSRCLGYSTTLVAMKVAEPELGKAEKVIVDHPLVSHGYEREHQFNVWFTLALPSGRDIEAERDMLTASAGAEAAFSLPALQVFKIGAFFDIDENGETAPTDHRSGVLARQVKLSRADRLIINEIQQDLALVFEPFKAMSKNLGMEVERFLAGCLSLQQRGVIRRFSASVNHRNAGFTANAMSCWIVPGDKVNAVGQKLASLKEVSHCYERKTNPLWQYNIFAMIHGRSRQVCRDIVDKVSMETGLTDYALLYSTKEFKKTRAKYLI